MEEEGGAAESSAESSRQEEDVVPSEQASFLEGLGLQHVSTVSFGNTRFKNQSEDGGNRGCVAVVPPCKRMRSLSLR